MQPTIRGIPCVVRAVYAAALVAFATSVVLFTAHSASAGCDSGRVPWTAGYGCPDGCENGGTSSYCASTEYQVLGCYYDDTMDPCGQSPPCNNYVLFHADGC
jgi:hypothetical protein